MKILLVDSDSETIAAIIPALNALPGADLRAANSGEHALQYAAEWEHVDWLITEVFLDPMNGFTLRNKLQNRYRGVKTIFLSAYDLTPYAEHVQGANVIAKPVNVAALLDIIGKRTQDLAAAPAEPEKPPAAAAPAPAAPPVSPAPVAPRAVAAARPGAVPVPKIAPPAATPAVPRVAAAAPSAPVSVPKVAPASAAAPQAVPRPTAVPVPKAAAAVPKVTGAPTAIPRVSGTPQAGAVPVARPAVSALPQATPVAKAGIPVVRPARVPITPKAPAGAVPVARPAAVPASPKAAVVAAPAEAADPLIGQTIGTYKIVRKIAPGKWGSTYEAIQTTMNRPVGMIILDPALERDPEAKTQFIANASAKANVQHPLILSVYEAGETGGHCYYTHEFVDGAHFGELVAKGATIDDLTALQTVKTAATALHHFQQKKIPHSELLGADLYLGRDKRARLNNLATHFDEHPEVYAEMNTLSTVVSSALPGGEAGDAGLRAMLHRMRKPGAAGFESWPALLQAVKALEPKVVPADAYKISARDEAAIRAVEEAKKRQKKQVLFSVIGAVALVAVSAFAVWRVFFQSNEKNLEVMVPIPAGEFIYQEGQKKTLPAFYMSKYEVTMGEYGKFLAFLKKHPTKEFDHPKQPPGESHIPSDQAGWDIYYGRAKRGKMARFVPIDLNCPVFNVDFWDAYAYAKWRGGRLPTEEEWEKAARGTDGRPFPWGTASDPKKANGIADYVANPGPDTKGKVDGYWWWSPVDAFPSDVSPFGIVGMAGNLSEWTNTWVDDKPVIRGGNFRNEDFKVTRRVLNAEADTFTESLGFRIASDKPLTPR